MRYFRLLTLSLVSVFLLSMSEAPEIPPELRNLKAKVQDVKGVVHELTAFRCNEGATLKFRKGSLDYSISLSSVRSIEVVGMDEEGVKVKVRMKDGSTETFLLPASTRCTAQTKTGNVSFYINEVRKIELIQGEGR